MKGLSIRLRVTLLFGVILLILVGLTFTVILYVSSAVMQKTVRDNLIEAVEDNVDEIEFFNTIEEAKGDHNLDIYLQFGTGYLEIDDDFLDKVNGISIALYQENGSLLYGENPFSQDFSDIIFSDLSVQKKSVNGKSWYVFDRKLEGNGREGLWLRGVVSTEQGDAHFSSIFEFSLILMPALLILAVLGGYFIAGTSLKPIRKIAQTASEIGHGQDLKKRIDLGKGRDELHQLADVFNDMFDRLDSSFEKERQFTSDVSHELRTPMTVIMAQCEYLLEKSRTEKEYQDGMKLIQRQGSKMTQLIADMLAFARMEFHVDSFEMKPLNFSELVCSVCEDMSHIPDKDITLIYETDKDVFINGNYDLLTRLLTNLISNAYRYGKEKGYIKVTLVSSPHNVVLSVSDDGVGIASEDLEKIFQRFYRTDKARSSSGTGIGLAMVREIAELHKGTIFVDSAIGQGSTFAFLISKNPPFKK